ncbi:MAG: IclR family transcriptional regulator [Rickettsiales bacterium]
MAKSTPVRRRQVPAVTRAVAILRQLGKSPEPVGVNQLARELSLVPSTCLHILRVLTEEGLVSFDSNSKRYTIDVGILPIARSAIRRNGFATLIEPRLTRLSRDFGVTAVATQLADSEHMVVVALSDASLPFRLQVDLGSRFPALISATGRCHAAFNLGGLSEAELRARFEKLSWDDPPAYDDWRQDVRGTRRDGYAIDRGCYIGGVSILAVPFLNRTARMTHSIVAIGISDRIASLGIPSIVDAMQRVRDEVDDLLIGPSVDGV